MKINWDRIERTAIQSGSGALAGALAVLLTGFSWKSFGIALLTAAVATATAVLMNIQKQADEAIEKEGE